MRPKHVRLFPAPAWCGWRSQTTPAMNLLTRVPSFRRGAAAGSAPGDADTHTEPPPSPEGEETHDNDIRFRAVDTDTGLAVDLRTGMAWPSAELRQGPRQPNGGGGPLDTLSLIYLSLSQLIYPPHHINYRNIHLIRIKYIHLSHHNPLCKHLIM